MIKNSFYNFIIQFSNYLIPLLLIPYLTRTLGQESFGKIAFTQSFVMLANILPEYGFSLSATRDIASNRSNVELLGLIVSKTIFSKLALLIVATIIISPLYFIIPIFKDDVILFLSGFILLATISINTDWFFLGMESLKSYTIATVLGKIILISFTFYFIDNKSNPHTYLLILAFSTLLTNFINLLNLKNKVKLIIPRFNEILVNIKESVNLFVFKFTVSLYTSANAFIVGLLLTPKEVGIFSGAEKIVKAFAGLWVPMNNAIYPRVNNLINKDFNAAKKIIKVSLLFYSFLSLTLVIFLIFFGEKIVIVFLGRNFIEAAELLKILSPIIFLIAVSNVLGILWLLPLKRDKEFNFIIISAGILNLLLGVPLTNYFGITGMAISITITEFFVTIYCIYTVSKFKEARVV